MKRRTCLALLLAAALALSGCSIAETAASEGEGIVFVDTSGMDFAFTDRELSGEIDEENATRITGDGENITIDGPGAQLSSGGVSIVDEGCYILSGEIRNAMVTVVAPEDEKVQLVLSGVELVNESGPAIYIRSADKLFLTAKDGTLNTIADGGNYSLSEDGSNVDAAIFSRADLVLNGGGSLRIEGRNKHGVVSKDDLVIANCTLDVQAKKVGLNGKDCLKIHGGSLTVAAGTDGLRSDNDEDENRGYIFLENTSLNITAENDGIQAETVLKCVDSDLCIQAGGGSGQALSEDDNSCKGLKAGQDILLSGGSGSIDSRDDCIHAGGNVQLSGGDFTLSSGDDGLHADAGLAVSGGSYEILRSYEGVEGSEIRITGGTLRITASDDGMNLAGGSDSSAMSDRPGRGMFDTVDGSLEISGGYVWIDAAGDGMDSNGSIDISGGVTLVCGPTNSGNAAFDYGTGATVTGGVLIAAGSAGMAQGFSSAENQGAIFITFEEQQAGTNIALCDADGNVLAGFAPSKRYSSAVITAPGIQAGESYALISGATLSEAGADGFAQSGTADGGTELAAIEMTDILYGSGSMGFGGMMGGGRGFGKHREALSEDFEGFDGMRPQMDARPGDFEDMDLPADGAMEMPPEGFEAMPFPDGEMMQPPNDAGGMIPDGAAFGGGRPEKQ